VKLLRLTLALILTCVAVGAHAVASGASLTWTAPTANTDGTPIAGALTYNIYQGATAATLTKVASGLTSTTGAVTAGLTAGTTQYFAVTAVANGMESAQTPVAALAIPFPTPNAPTSLACTMQVLSSTSTTATITITCKAPG
jgi:hypothetical protein